MPVRLLITDIDGTLVRHDKSLSAANAAAIERVRAAGIRVALISARPPSGMRWIIDEIGLDGPFGAFNGATLFDRAGHVSRADHIPAKEARTALRLMDRPGVSRWLYANGQWFVTDLANAHLVRERVAAAREPILAPDLDPHVTAADKIVAVCDDAALLSEIEREVAAAVGADANVVRSQDYYLDVLAPTGNKGDGVRALARAYGVDLAEVAVFGDQRNDLAMFAVAGLSVAMGQAPAEVKAAATHVARSNDDDGVADAIDRFLLAGQLGADPPVAAPARDE